MASISKKKKAAGKLSKHRWTLGEKMKISDKVKKRKKMSCREIEEKFKIKIVTTQPVNIVTNEARLREEYEKFQGKGFKHIQWEKHQKYKVINDTQDSRYKKCHTSGIYVTGPIPKKETRNIKPSLDQPRLKYFKASESWLDKWKLTRGIREKQRSEESLDESETIVESWMVSLRFF